MIYATGDLHGNSLRFQPQYFPEQANMTKDDYMIVCGDFGCVWNGDKSDDPQLNRLEALPSDEECAEARQTLERLDWKVDYIITHCAPTAIQQKINANFKPDKLTDFLEEIRNRSQFHYWLFGHYHDNRIIDEKYVLLYEQMVQIL